MVLHLVQKASSLQAPPPAAEPWHQKSLQGAVVELSGLGASAQLSSAVCILRSLQEAGEPTAWISDRDSLPFLPDLQAWGLDLEALALIRPPRPEQLGRAADLLLRSGAFGGVVVDLQTRTLPHPLLSRLSGLCARHQSSLVLLSAKADEAPSLGVGVTWRSAVSRQHRGPDDFILNWRALKDRRGAGVWTWHWSCRGAVGCP